MAELKDYKKLIEEYERNSRGAIGYTDYFKNLGDDELEKMCQLVEDSNVLNAYVFGSQLYGSANDKSDVDMIVIAMEWFDSGNVNVRVYTSSQFLLLLKRQDIQALECVNAPKEFVLKERLPVSHVIDKSLLRVSISTIVSNSWVKGQKKLTVTGDYNLGLALKSVFHSLRILDYGIQLASSGKIENWTSSNFILEDLWKMSESHQRDELWYNINVKYKSLYNSRSSEFKRLAPKDLSEQDNKIKLDRLLEAHGVKFLADEIFNIFQK
jgi:hypothetical protein